MDALWECEGPPADRKHLRMAPGGPTSPQRGETRPVSPPPWTTTQDGLLQTWPSLLLFVARPGPQSRPPPPGRGDEVVVPLRGCGCLGGPGARSTWGRCCG